MISLGSWASPWMMPTFFLLPYDRSSIFFFRSRSSSSARSRIRFSIALRVLVVEARRVLQQIDRPHVVVVEDLGRQVADLLPDLRAELGDVLAEDGRRAARRVDEPEESPDGRGLPGAVRPDEAVDLALVDGHVDIDDAPGLAVVLGQLRWSRSHSSSAPVVACGRTPAVPPVTLPVSSLAAHPFSTPTLQNMVLRNST